MKHIILLILFALLLTNNTKAQYTDTPFKQPISVKYENSAELEGAKLKKVVVDYNQNIYVLTDNGLFRDYGTLLSRDVLYRAQAGLKPVDVTIQEKTGYIYFLYKNKYFTNAHAGTIYANLPTNEYNSLIVNSNYDVLFVGNNKAALYNKRVKVSDLSLPKGELLKLYVDDSKFYYLTKDKIYRLEGEKWQTVHKGKNLTSIAFSNNSIIVGTTNGYYSVNNLTGRLTQKTNKKLPVPSINDLLVVNGKIWFTSANGAFMKEGDKFRYFASKRWLDNNKIVDIDSDENGNVYLLSETGLNKIEYVNHTLADKAKHYQDNIRKYHLRYGFISATSFKEIGDITTMQVYDHDNDGLWSSFYLTSQAFRYAVTGEEKARRYAWETFEVFERLLTVNPLKGFPSRTFEKRGVIDHEAWRPSQEEEWDWKGTTSTDEYIAYLFLGAVMDQLIAKTPEEKKRVADFICPIMTHIIENDYYFIDIDGNPTLWGRWNPEYVNMFPKDVYDRRLNSLHLIAGLQLAYSLSGDEIYKSEAYRVMDEWGYRENMFLKMSDMGINPVDYNGIQMGDGWNHSDDEMAFFTHWVSYFYAFDEELKQEYTKAFRDHWELELPERNALWNLIQYAISGDIDKASTIWHLQEFPMDLMPYGMKNSHRKDLDFIPENFRGQTTKELISPLERRAHRHNSNPFNLDSNDSHEMLVGDEFLLPYWMGRYLGIISAPVKE
jgi:hypothetical protein